MSSPSQQGWSCGVFLRVTSHAQSGRVVSMNRLPGRRWCLQDTAVELNRLIPPFRGASDAELGYLAGQTLLPIDVEGDRQYFVSIPHGRIMRKELLLEVLKGELDEKRL